MNERTNKWTNEWMHACMHELKLNKLSWIELSCIHEWTSEWVSEAMNAWMNEWSNECLNECTNEAMKFTDLIFQKCSDPFSFHFYVTPSSRYSPVHFLPTAFADRGPHLRKQRPYSGDHGSHFTRKHRVLRPGVFSSLNSCVPDLLHLPTTWWPCGWHDGANAAHENRP